jgi:murein DD-endopeptidase MepM/ murein hydrolase activator NlpD
MAKKNSNKKKSILSRLRYRYRISVLYDEHFGERISFRLSVANLLVIGGGILIFFVALTIYLVAFTGLREYIPGYSDVDSQRKLLKLVQQNDSLETKISQHDLVLDKLQQVLSGNLIPDELPESLDAAALMVEGQNRKSREDSLLRKYIESEERFSIAADPILQKNPLKLLLPPIRGAITDTFNRRKGHFGIDIAANRNEAVLAIQEGTVILSAWTAETGHIIVIQHANNLVSIYKHNAVLLKKEGAFVKPGEPIAIVGNSGEYTTGPHLHLEIWINGNPINPLEILNF